MSRATSRALLGLLAGSSLCSVAHADRPKYGAFIDVQQIGEVQIAGSGGDDVTYTEVSGNLTAQINNRRVVVSASYRLSYRIPELGNVDKSLSQDGVLRAQVNLIDEWLTMDGGAVITRSRVDPSGSAPQFNTANAANLTQTYSAYVQPNLTHRFGDVAVGGVYRYAYTRNEGRQKNFSSGPITNRFDSSTSQQGNARVAMENSSLPFDWNVSSQYRHENTTNLAEHTRSLNVVAEVKVPIATTVALVASGGYERTKISEGEALIDPITGFPVLDPSGRFLIDPTKPRILTYDVAGLIGDGGIIWKPSRRSRFEARAGYRYGGLSFNALAELHPNDRTGLTLIITDGIQSFGNSVSNGIANSPVNLDLGQSIDPGSSYQDCLFGKKTGTGQCIAGALGQASANSYRERAGSIIFNRRMRQWNLSTTLGYTHRTYIDQPGTPFSLDGVVDQGIFGDVTMSGRLTRTSGVSFSFQGNLFKNGQVGASDVISGSVSSNYYRTFGRGIRAQATVAVDTTKQDGIAADVSGRAQLGVQYQF